MFASGGPAILFANVVGCQFPMVSNLFGTMPRVRFIFRKTIEHVRRLIDMKMEPETFFKAPLQGAASGARAIHMMPKTVRSGPAIANQTQISKLPPLKSWPMDGGAFVTLPVVYTEDVEKPGLRGSNLGMYRIQLTGNDYCARRRDRFALPASPRHRSASHQSDCRRQPFRVNIFVGGAPACRSPP